MAWGDSRRRRSESLRQAIEQAFAGAGEAFVQLDRNAEFLRSRVAAYQRLASVRSIGQESIDFDKLMAIVDAVTNRYLGAAERFNAAQRGSADTDLTSEAQAVTAALLAANAQVLEFEARHPTIARALADATAQRSELMRRGDQALAAARAAGTAMAERGLVSAVLNDLIARLRTEDIRRHATPTISPDLADATASIETLADTAVGLSNEIVGLYLGFDEQYVSLRTRLDAADVRVSRASEILSHLRRRYSLECSRDLDGIPEKAEEKLALARESFGSLAALRRQGQWDDVRSVREQVRQYLSEVDRDVAMVEERQTGIDDIAADPGGALAQVRFRLTDAQRLAVSSGGEVLRAEGETLNVLAVRLGAAEQLVASTRPDLWELHQELKAIETLVAGSVARMRRLLGGAGV